MKHADTELIKPGSFDVEKHFYPRVINAQPHPMVNYFKSLSIDQVINRFCHLKPNVDPKALHEVIHYKPSYLRWAGVDLFHVATAQGNRRMIVVETNSCPSGQKSMPQDSFADGQGGYSALVKHILLPAFTSTKALPGKAAVIYDKNYVEASGYAAALADELHEDVYLVPFYNKAVDKLVKVDDGVVSIRYDHHWFPVRAAFRYLTQKPWNRLPIKSKTKIFNPIIGCLAGGRNKMIAAKAYDMFNAELIKTGLKIHTPETICDVGKAEVPFWVQRFGGHAVVKNPYSNAGQGVYTLTSPQEIDRFMATESEYGQFIVQSLIGNSEWSSDTKQGTYYHVGTVPNRLNQIYAADLRMMGCYSEEGFKPLAIYGRRAAAPLPRSIEGEFDSWKILGTNLSVKKGENSWDTDVSRLILTDVKDFNLMGISFDELIEGYVQLVLAVNAIDRMAKNLINTKGDLKIKLFKSFVNDDALIDEIMECNETFG